MSSSPYDALKKIKDSQVSFVDFQFSDLCARPHQITMPVEQVTEDCLRTGIPFDGSSVKGWVGIERSDMLAIPDLDTAVIDSFHSVKAISFFSDIYEVGGGSYGRDSRGVAYRAEKYLHSLGWVDRAFFGPEAEFFILDDVKWSIGSSGSSVKLFSSQVPSSWGDSSSCCSHSAVRNSYGEMGYHPRVKEGYMLSPPMDVLYDIRTEICQFLIEWGIPVEVHHREVAAMGQCEVGTRFSTLLQRADWNQRFKYIVKRVARMHGKSATFMPKPVMGDNGSGMHCHISLWKDSSNLFVGDQHVGLSKLALYFIGGVLYHARALNALVNPSTNSYRRLIAGFEAPVKLAYSSCNRSAAIRIPHTNSDSGKRIEVRFPDALCNPYLAFSALLMAGLDGIQNQIDPGTPVDRNMYEASSENSKIPNLCATLEDALFALDRDRAFLTAGGVFTDDLINAYIALKQEEIFMTRAVPHPVEFDLYYAL